MNIAVIMTCFNRKQKTITCLQSLYFARNQSQFDLNLHLFLTDDKCTDGTADAIKENFPSEKITILRGNGSLFWAGGMRLSWREAMIYSDNWDYYLLLNDDVELMENVFVELFNAQKFNISKFGKEGLVSGITCAFDNPEKLTYGGVVLTNRFLAKGKPLMPIGVPQPCDRTNANILLVPKTVVDQVGIFYDGFIHGHADTDYSIMVRRKGFPVMLTAHFCGRCDNDHESREVLAHKIIKMSLKERKDYFRHPLHSTSDYLCAIRRTAPIRLPFVWIGRMLNLYLPKLYYFSKGIR